MPTEDNRFFVPMVPTQAPAGEQHPRSGRFPFQFVYKNGDNFVMIDESTYELFEFTEASVGPASRFLKEGQDGITVSFLSDFIVCLELPAIVELKVIELIPQIDPSPEDTNLVAILCTGAKVTVPPIVQIGNIVQIDTKNGKFAGIREPADASEI